MAESRITVLLPVFNGEDYLQEALDSILGQTYGEFLLYVCNDGSSDGTKEILDRCDDPRLHVFEQENTGIVSSLNRMMQSAQTEFVVRHDADDISHSERFARQIEYLDAHPEVGLLGSYACKICAQGEEMGCITPHLKHEEIVSNLPNYNQFVHGSVMMRRQDCRRAGGYSSIFTHGEDYELWFRLTRVTRAANLPEKLYSYRVHDAQIQAREAVKQQRIRNFVSSFSMSEAYDIMMDADRNAEIRSLKLVNDVLPEQGVSLLVPDQESLLLHLPRALELFHPDEVVLSCGLWDEFADLVTDISAASEVNPNVRREIIRDHNHG